MKEKCKSCSRPSKGCIPYIMTLTTPELCEWCRMWKNRLDWSNQDLADKSDVPKGTVDRILAPNNKDVKLVTIRPIICAIVGCTAEELSQCEIEPPNTSLQAEVKELQNRILQLEKENKWQAEKIQILSKEHEESIEQQHFLQDQIHWRTKIISVLGTILFFVSILIIVALIIDRLNSTIGFFWIDPIAKLFNGNQTGLKFFG